MATVFRPRAALWMAVGLSVVLILAAALGWQLLPDDVRVLFTGIQIATLSLFLVVMVVVMLAIGASSVSADDAGLLVRNGLRSHRILWQEVEGFRFTPDDPWASVQLLVEPGTRPIMALQRVDGDRARKALQTLEQLWRDHREAA